METRGLVLVWLKIIIHWCWNIIVGVILDIRLIERADGYCKASYRRYKEE